jgi:hypothetical protein
MNSAFPFSIPVSVYEGTGGPVTVQAPWTESLSSLQASASGAVVLYNDFGSDAAGLYILFNKRWNFAAPYATVANFIISGGTINVYAGLTAPVTPEAGSTVFRNGVQSTATTLTTDPVTWATVALANSAGYQLPVATASVLGGVKQGSGVTIAGDGTISASGTSYTLPNATTTTLGGVIVGSGINVSAGTISVTPYTLPAATTSTLGGVIVGSGITLTGSTISVTPYTLPAATTAALGGVIVGAGLAVTAGTISATAVGANPTGTAGLAVVNGAATTFMRSDAAPAISQAIVPTWTAIHTFSASPVVPTLTATDNTTKAANTATAQLIAAAQGTTAANTAVSAGHGQPYDVVMPYAATLTAGEVILSYVAPRPLTFAAGGALSWAWAKTAAATTEVQFQILVGATPVGTITFAVGSTEGIPTFTSVTNMTAGQILSVTVPASPDAALAGLTVTLGGSLT